MHGHEAATINLLRHLMYICIGIDEQKHLVNFGLQEANDPSQYIKKNEAIRDAPGVWRSLGIHPRVG